MDFRELVEHVCYGRLLLRAVDCREPPDLVRVDFRELMVGEGLPIANDPVWVEFSHAGENNTAG
jgi:hypothetical protein